MIRYVLESPDQEDKYPANIHISAEYLLKGKELHLTMKARLAEGETQSTPINLTNHSYFNLIL